MIRKDYSVTSNIAKLLKHLDTLQNLQRGIVRPIMIHAIPTHRCQLNCVHCCFKNRKDKTADMSLEWFMEGMKQFRQLGTKAIEFTGGGDPTLWPPINEAMGYLRRLGFRMGIITNNLAADKIEHWEWFDWVRVSLNTLDYRDNIELDYLKNTYTSFCYIWNEHSVKNINRVIKFANDHKTICRVAPDCIVPLHKIQEQMDVIRGVLNHGHPENEYVFLSDFNIDLKRRNHDCRIHMIKPCFYLDGWVYSCPSAELAVENDKQIQPKTKVCKYDEIYKWYHNPEALMPRDSDCSYCKYVKQQELLEDLLAETTFNEFA